MRPRHAAWMVLAMGLLLCAPCHAREVSLQVRWDHQFQFAGYYAAQWQGHYAREGLAVDIRPGLTPQGRILSAVEEVASGRADFGIGAADILVAHQAGPPLAVTATIFQQSAAAFFMLRETAFSSLADFTRLRVARRLNDLIDVEMQAMLRAEGIDPGLVVPREHSPGLDSLLEGRVDVAPGYTISYSLDAARHGVDLRLIRPADYGVDFYGDSLFTTRSLMRSDPELVRRFTRASLRGWDYALAHPQEVADRIAAQLPRSYILPDPVAFNRHQAEEVARLTLQPMVELGHTNPERWRRMHGHLREAGLVAGELDAETFVFDPDRSAREHAQRVERLILVAGPALTVLAVLALAWVTVLRRAVRAKTARLRESEERFRGMIENLRDAVFVHEVLPDGMPGPFLDCNQAALDRLGMDREELLRHTPQSLDEPEVVAQVVPRVMALLETEGHALFESVQVAKDGRRIPVENHTSLVRVGDKKLLFTVCRDVSDRKNAQRILGENEARIRNLFDHVPVGMFESTPEGRFLYVNAAIAAMLGYDSPAEVMETVNRSSIAEALYADPDRRPRLVAEVASGGRHWKTFENQYRRKDGQLVDAILTFTRAEDFVTGEDRLYGFVLDLSERTEAERRLREALDRLRAHIDSSPLAVVEWDSQGRIVAWKGRAEQVFGWSAEELLGKSWDDWAFILPEDAPAVQDQIGRLFDGQVAYNTITNRNLRKDGSVVHCRWHNSALLDGEGRLSSILSQVEDVSEQKCAQEALEASEHRLRAMFEHMGSGVAVYQAVDDGSDFRITDFNPMAERITRVERETVVGRTLLEMFPHMDRSGLLDALRRVWKEGVYVHLPPFHYRDDMREGWRENRLFRLPSGEVVAIFDDVTERMEDQKALVRAKEAAEAANRTKSVFLANMSHEVRTPLNGVMGMLQVMMTTPLDSEQREYADTAVQSCKRLAALLGDILDLSKIEAGGTELREEPFDLDTVFDTVHKLFYAAAAQKGLALHLYRHPAVPASLVGDAAHLHQVLGNLVGNAIKFTDAGKVAVEAYPLPCPEPGPEPGLTRVLFTVTDTGEGIDNDKLENLFEPFTQADTSSTRRHQGAGLGLAIVRKLVGLMGGHVEAHGVPGVGTAFHVCLGFATGSAGGKSAQAETAPATATNALHVLVAEDDPVNSLALVRLLEKSGCRVTAVADGAAALEALRQAGDAPFGLVFMDIQMPGMDGLEAVAAIRAGEAGESVRGLPVVALTAYAMSGDRERFLEAGMDDYLAKPVEAASLSRTLARHWPGGR